MKGIRLVEKYHYAVPLQNGTWLKIELKKDFTINVLETLYLKPWGQEMTFKRWDTIIKTTLLKLNYL